MTGLDGLYDGHGWYRMMRYPWPWGLVLPNQWRCLYCGAVRRKATLVCPRP